jgi:mycothiol synthase
MEEFFRQLVEAGYQVRPATYDDLPQVVSMVNAAEVELTGAGDWTVERWQEEWRQGGIDLAASTRVVMAPDGSMVGCIELWDQTNPPARPWIWGRVHPQWKGRGIGSAMLTWALSSSLRALDRLPDDARLAPYVAAPADHKPSVELFESMGMSVCRHAWHMLMDLDAPLPEPPWPAGLQVRVLRYPDDLEATFQALDEAFCDHWGHVDQPFEDAFNRWKRYSFDAMGLKPELFFLALDGDRIAGLINAQERDPADSQRGWIPTLGVRRAYRRQGLGQALLLHAFHALQERGIARVGLAVDATSKTGAMRLYQRVGMRVQLEVTLYELELRPGRELAVAD